MFSRIAKLKNYYELHKNAVKSAFGMLTLYLTIGVFLLAFMPWKGTIHDCHYLKCASKSEVSLAILKVFNVINVFFVALIGLAASVETLFSVIGNTLLSYFSLLSFLKPAEGPSTAFTTVQAMISVFVCSHLAYLILVAVVYQN